MFRNRITILRITHTIDNAGGLTSVTMTQWSKWAKVENRTGSDFFSRGQREWEYTYKITTRYEASRQERSEDMVVFDGKMLRIKELHYENEGMKRFVVSRCSTVGEDYIDVLSSMGIYTFIYTATGGEMAFTESTLSGKTIIAASKDGIEYAVYSKDVKETPEGKEMVYDGGAMEWGVEFEPGEVAIIHYTELQDGQPV